MADRLGLPRQVGDIVYRPYSPLALGRVVAVKKRSVSDEFMKNSPYEQKLEVHWKDGSRTWYDGEDVLRLLDLIANHEKKLEGHRKRMAEVLAWKVPNG